MAGLLPLPRRDLSPPSTLKEARQSPGLASPLLRRVHGEVVSANKSPAWEMRCVLLLSLTGLVAVRGLATPLPLTRPPLSVPNFRDLGLTRCANNRVVRPGVLYRAATPCNITAEDESQLTSIRTVLDLRSQHDAHKDSGERRLAPKTAYKPLLNEEMMRGAMLERARKRPAVFAHVIALGVAKKLSPSRRLRDRLAAASDVRLARLFDTVSLADVYWLILSQSTDLLREACELAATEESLPLLIHCTHGKDRTGVLVALLLLAVGVSEDAVLADYALSHEWGCSVEGQHAMRQSFPERLRPYLRDGLLEEWCCAPVGELQQVLRRLESEHGSVAAYLDSIGVDDSCRRQLAVVLTQEAAGVGGP